MKTKIHTDLDILASKEICKIEIRNRTLEWGKIKLSFANCSEIHSFKTFILIIPGTVLGDRNTMINLTDKD